MTTGNPGRLAGWLDRAKVAVEAIDLAATTEQFGCVESVADGVAQISGLPETRLDELLRFEAGQYGFTLTLERETIGCVLLDDIADVEAGDRVYATGEVVRVPVGPGLLGRIVDPLGRPLDTDAPVPAERRDPVERPAPEIVDRDFVSEPVATGVLVIDAMFALGRGQRELILGDRAIGKTALAVDCIINQRDSDIVCVYVAVGQRTSATRRAVEAIRTHGAFERCIVVAANASATPGLQWIAPFAGMTMAEYFRDNGQHALVVIDDLTKHAATHREIALLTHQPPGREAYPGDVFYVHARLLERAAKLSPEKGGGSLTALPIAELDAGNLSAYIPTNLISITDGQIVFDARLFHEGHKPAVDVGTSVSRVGGKTQAPALRDSAQTLKLDYAQFLELEIFTRFGGMSDARVRGQIERGERTRALLAQPQFAPLRLADEVALLIALHEGILDRLPVEKVRAFRSQMPAWLDKSAAATIKAIGASSKIDEAGRNQLVATLTELAERLAPTNNAGGRHG